MPEAERLDSRGNPLPCIGHITTKSLDYQGAKYFIDVEERAVYGKPFNDDVKRVVAPGTLIYEKSSLSNSLIAHLAHPKFHDHFPPYSIEQHLEAASLNTYIRQKMGRALMQAALDKDVQGVCDIIQSEIMTNSVAQVDDTTCRMLKPGYKKCQITCFGVVTNGKNAWYQHALSRAGYVCHDTLACKP